MKLGPTIAKPDAIVVGSGAGGATAARVLAARGKSVLVLEKGPLRRADDFLPYDELHFAQHKALIPQVVNDPNIYVDPAGKADRSERWWIANMVGGSTMLWESNLPRYTHEDFALASVMKDLPTDASVVDWPWTYDEFQPYFERAEHEWGVSGRANSSPAQEPTRPGYDYPMPPLRDHASTAFLLKAFNKAGYQPYRSPRGINTQTYQGRPACPYCGYCQGFGCAVNDRANAWNTMMVRALATGKCELRTGHNVTRLDHHKGKVRGVFYKTEPNGPEHHIAADQVFVSVQAIEAARLFLLSGVPNRNGLVGRYLTYHAKGSAELRFPGVAPWDGGPHGTDQPRTALGSLQLRDLYLIKDPARPDLTKGGKFSIYDPYTVETPIKVLLRSNLWGKALQDRIDELRSQAGVSFSFTGETLSMYDNRVELDPGVRDPWGQPVARVFYRHHPYDLKISTYCLDKVTEALVNAGGVLLGKSPQKEANPGYGHNHGTLRAGRDPGASVLSPMCESHEVAGLHVLDCSWMPTAGASNPTLTLIANAFRVCEQVP